ncbi:O-antigen ligase family protein [Acholeplasma equifetale]|uniref:O-antigen ligase family protein n=1 Tax=Acholeplasma equifetale TaxID=264634 RepID=UPI00047A8C2E|nr:O-antigen ligase family protein [Acholeplasma equifetale]
MNYILIFIFLILTVLLIVKHRIYGLLYSSALLLPFRISVININNIEIRFNDILYIFTIFFCLYQIFKNKKKINFNLNLNLLMTLIFLMIISIVINYFLYTNITTFIDFIRLSLGVLTGIVAFILLDEKKKIHIFFKYWLLGTMGISLITIGTFFYNGNNLNVLLSLTSLDASSFYKLKFSNSIFFEDPNNLGSYLLISLFISFGYLFSIKGNKIFKYFVIVSVVLAILLTLSRSAYLAFGICIVISLFIFVKEKYFIKSLIIGVIIFILIYFIKGFTNDISAMSRLGLWKIGLNMTIHNPILGVGLGNSNLLFYEYIGDFDLLIDNPYFHNLYLKISSELGLISLFIFIILCISIFRISISNKHSNLMRWASIGVLAFLCQAFFVEYFESRHFWIIFVFLLGQKNTEVNYGTCISNHTYI